ncbi:formate dehydrogenase accessory sulfurtransferase FdhD [Bauldia sp.]|uniref:formate dehydrogenase accessory sulfurtransferase FdhD n=1 Tax=Bauldia sp. TaxID=2575872 RepID=UPI00345BB2EC
MKPVVESSRIVETVCWRRGEHAAAGRAVPEEAAVALTYDGSTHAVMMATPADLEDFAIGFSLTEGVVGSPAEIETIEVVEEDAGIELRMRLAEPGATALAARRRFLAGPVGCGLCGIESLNEALRPVPTVDGGAAVSYHTILGALAGLRGGQPLHRETHAVHAAAFWRRDGEMVAVREDVGRHNALDKLAGALATEGVPTADGFILMTSRVSVELVQKAAMIGVSMLVAVSAPTALAIRIAEAAGMTIAAVARDDGFEVFSHPDRVIGAKVGDAVR